MQNSIVYILGISVALLISSCNCHRNSSKAADCASLMERKDLPFDTSKDVEAYIEDITNHVSDLKSNDMKKSYLNCTKPEIVKYYLIKHPVVDSVTIAPGSHGVSFHRNDQNVWSNVLIN